MKIPRTLFDEATKKDPYATMVVCEQWQNSDMTDEELMSALKSIAGWRD